MKRKLLTFALGLTAVFSASTVAAQNRNIGPEWGDNDSTRLYNYRNYGFLQEAFNMKLYDEAAGYLQELMAAVPGARSQIYHAGINIYKTKFNTATDDAQKKVFMDSLMLVYDKWIEHFGTHPEQGRAYLTRAKAVDYMNMMADDREGISKLLKEAIAADSTMKYPDILLVYFQHLTDDYKLFQTLDADTYLSAYEELAERIDAATSPEKDKTKETLDALAVSSGALDCGSLETIYGPQLEANPQDTTLYTKVMALLRRNKCDGPFYAKVSEALFKLNPSAQSTLALAASFEEKKEFAKAIEILTDALSKETDPKAKESLYVRIAADHLQSKNAKAAADNAKQAIAVNPESGLGYYTLAQAYALGSNACAEGFERQTVYWLVYDNLVVARRLLEKDGNNQIKNIDSEMVTYRNNFPLKEETFFRELQEGSAYTVNCGWISGNTTVRTVK